MSLLSQATVPSPAFVQRTSVLHVSHLYLLPSWFAIFISPENGTRFYFFNSMGLLQQVIWPLPPLVTINSEPQTVQTYFLPTWLAIVIPSRA
jgi:hypothetical protein